MKERRALTILVVLAAFAACGGERLPAASARPEGQKWYCASGSWVACGRTKDECTEQNVRIGTRVVNPGDPPKGDECAQQPTAVCFTFVDGESNKTVYDCFVDRVQCEGYLKEAARSPTAFKDTSVCGTWD
jgi:hypothetical protein